MLWPYVTSPGKFPPRVPGPTFRGHCCPAVNRCVFWGIRWWLNLRNEHMLGKWSTWGSPIKVAPYPKEIYITLGLSQGLFNNTQCQEVCMTRFIKRVDDEGSPQSLCWFLFQKSHAPWRHSNTLPYLLLQWTCAKFCPGLPGFLLRL